MYNFEISTTFRPLTQLVTTQVKIVTNHVMAETNQTVGLGDNPNTSTLSSRIRDFIRINPPTSHGTKVDKYP